MALLDANAAITGSSAITGASLMAFGAVADVTGDADTTGDVTGTFGIAASVSGDGQMVTAARVGLGAVVGLAGDATATAALPVFLVDSAVSGDATAAGTAALSAEVSAAVSGDASVSAAASLSLETAAVVAGDADSVADINALLSGVWETISFPGFSVNSVAFDGVDEYVTCGSTFGFDRTDTMSVTCWFRATANGYLVAKQAAGPVGWGLYLSGGKVGFEMVNTDTTDHLRVETTTATFADNAWRQVLVTFDGSSSASGVTIYVDGQAEATTTVYDTLSSSIVNGGALYFGSREADHPTSAFTGCVDDVGLYGAELTSGDGTTIYNGGATVDLRVVGPTGDLLGYWLMGDGDTFPTIQDRSSTTPLTSSTSTTFDGSDDYISGNELYTRLGSGEHYQFLKAHAFSMSVWFKTSSATAQIMVAKWNPAGFPRGWKFLIDSSGRVEWRMEYSDTLTRLHVRTTASGFADGAWHHAVMTYDGSLDANNIHLFVDGSDEATTILNNDFSSFEMNTTVRMKIGADNGNNELFTGQIDDVSIHGRELTAAEVTTLYNGGLPGDVLTTGPRSALIGYYKMGDGDLFPWIRNQASVPYSPLTTSIYIQPERILSGVTVQKIQFGSFDEANMSKCEKFTWGCWVKQQAFNTNGVVLSKTDGSPPGPDIRGYSISVAENGPSASLNVSDGGLNDGTATVGSNCQIDDGRWHLVVATYNGDHEAITGRLFAYCDGVDVSSSSGGSGINNDAYDMINAGQVTVGAHGVYGLSELIGQVCHSFVYQGQLSGPEILALYGGGVPQDLTVVGPQPTSNFSQFCMRHRFGGAVRYVVIGDVAALQFERTDTFSVSAWFRIHESSSTTVVTKLSNTSPFPGWELAKTSTGTLTWRVVNAWVTNAMVVDTTTSWHDGEWHHVVATWDGDVIGGTGGAHIYVDGVDQPLSVVYDNLTGSSATSAPAQIGARDGGNQGWQGQIDDVAIYDKELTLSEVQAIYNNGVAVDNTLLPTNSNLVGYWLMGDGATYPTIPDVSTNSNDGTMTNMIAGDIRYREKRLVHWSALGDGGTTGVDGVPDLSGFTNHGEAVGVAASQFVSDLGDVPQGDNLADRSGKGNHMIYRAAFLQESHPFSRQLPTDGGFGRDLGQPDLSGQGNASTLPAANLENFVFPVDYPGSGDFFYHSFKSRNGGAVESISLGDNPAIDFDRTDPFSISIWFKTRDNQTTTIGLFGKCNNSSPYQGYELSMISGGSMILYLRDGTNTIQRQSSIGGLDDNAWHHILVSYDGSSTAAGISIVIDGVASNGATSGGPLTATILGSWSAVFSGQGFGSTWGGTAFLAEEGWMGHCSVYDTELTLSEAQAIYNSGEPLDVRGLSTVANLVGYWRLGDGSAGGVSRGFLVLNQNNAHDHIVICRYASADVDFERTDTFSISAWFKLEVGEASQWIVSKIDGTNLQGWGILAAAQPGFGLVGGDFTTAYDRIDTTASGFDDGCWHHIVCTNAGTGIGGMLIYIDGVLEATSSIVNTLGANSTLDPTAPLQFGNRSELHVDDTLCLDNIAIYDKVLSAGEVTTLYNSLRPVDHTVTGPTANLVGYWDMETWTGGVVDGLMVNMTAGSFSSDVSAPIGAVAADGTMTNMESGDIKTDVPAIPSGSSLTATALGDDEGAADLLGSATVSPAAGLTTTMEAAVSASSTVRPVALLRKKRVPKPAPPEQTVFEEERLVGYQPSSALPPVPSQKPTVVIDPGQLVRQTDGDTYTQTTLAGLSTGIRVQTPADDAASLEMQKRIAALAGTPTIASSSDDDDG